MEFRGKILTGVAATVVLALAGHFVTGEKFISGLEQQAETELAARGLDNTSVSFSRDPLSRSAVLDGDMPDDMKQEALGVVTAISGVSGASWKGEEDAGTADDGNDIAPAVDSGNPEEVTKCQNGVDKILESRKISFRSGSAYVSPQSNKILDELASALKNCAGLSIAVEGHTDDNGDSAVNRIMSQERADRIKAGLVERGIPASLITAKGYGSARPRATGSDAAADAKNRRIEFRIGAANGASQADAKAPQGE
ncbi:OmpA family protein [uncultured Parasphingorhabdus sp.]|uniref:OmpA family protein n=1 Tax=uncultured Parasphingorhabdus sp. TaxID=2709694 RepID=UPI0030DD41F8|tara:strand:- start:13753 stop:14514 length:762 start_codon:yes stop_codon:yes gene_type:complete